jgi:Protein of unknown function (DUF1279)
MATMTTTMTQHHGCHQHRQRCWRLCSSTAATSTNKPYRDFAGENKHKDHDDDHDDDRGATNKKKMNHNNNSDTTTTPMAATTATTTTTSTTKKETFGSMMRTYGPVFLGTYVTVYLSTLSALYAGVASGALDPVALFTTLGITSTAASSAAAVVASAGDGNGLLLLLPPPTTAVELVYNFLSHYELTKSYAHYVPDYPAVANFGVAWIAAKFTEPFRIPIAIGLTPRVAQSLGYRYRRQPPPLSPHQQHSPSLVVEEEKVEKHGQLGEKKP